MSEAVTGTPTTNDYFKLTFPKLRTLEKFTHRNVSLLTLTCLRRCQVVLLYQLFILWNTPQPLYSLSTEHCTYSDGFTSSEAVAGTPTTNDYFKLTFPKFRTLEKFTYRNVSHLTLTCLQRCQVVLLYQLFILWNTPQPFNSSNFQTFKPFKLFKHGTFIKNPSTLQTFKPF